jgi:myo-inositol-1(or 4)-monophosphatase
MPWDTAAGWLMIRESGGIVTDLFGGAFHLEGPHVLATNGKIHYDMVNMLKKIDRESMS